MRIVDLYDRVIRQVIESAAFCHTFIQNKPCTVADHKILLINPQQASILITVVRIQKQSQIPGDVLLIKFNPLLHNTLIYSLYIKEMQLICDIVVSRNFDIIHSGIQGHSPKADRIGHIRFSQPTLLLNPWIRGLFLQFLLKLLFKQAEMIIQANSVPVQPQCSDRVQKTGRQPSKPPISQGWLRLDFFDLTDVSAVSRENIPDLIVDTQIDHIVGE